MAIDMGECCIASPSFSRKWTTSPTWQYLTDFLMSQRRERALSTKSECFSSCILSWTWMSFVSLPMVQSSGLLCSSWKRLLSVHWCDYVVKSNLHKISAILDILMVFFRRMGVVGWEGEDCLMLDVSNMYCLWSFTPEETLDGNNELILITLEDEKPQNPKYSEMWQKC